MDILKSSRSLDVFPTPIDQIVQYSDLIVAGGIDVKSIQNRFKDFFLSEALISGLSKIRGFLDRTEKLIYLDLSQNNGRQGFVKLHETGHNVLPWQKQILEFIDDDNTLDETTKDEFEAEANYFASATLFQNDRFNRESKKYELGIPGALHCAKQFGASGHATLRRYVETNDSRCMLLVVDGLSPKGIILKGNLRNTFYSSAFLNEFGKIPLPNDFDFEWSFMQDYCFGKRMKLDGIIDLLVNGEMIEFCYHYFYNSFNVFVLIFPNGENKKTRTKIIIR